MPRMLWALSQTTVLGFASALPRLTYVLPSPTSL